MHYNIIQEFRIKRVVFLPLLLLGLLFSNVKADSGINDTSSFVYVGGNMGLAGREVGYSKFPLKVGGQVLYVWGHNTVKLAYNKISVFQFDNEPDTRERFNSIELCYGRVLRIGNVRLMFKNLYVGASTGLSVNFVDYFGNSGDAISHSIKSDTRFGIPFAIFTDFNFGSLVSGGFEYKYSILQRAFPSSEVSFSINVKVFEL